MTAADRVTTAEELDALPVGAVVLDRDGDAWQKGAADDLGFQWRIAGENCAGTPRYHLPATVLHDPTEPAPTPAPHGTDARAEAERRWPSYRAVGFSGAEDRQQAFIAGAQWRAGQGDPRDAEVERTAVADLRALGVEYDRVKAEVERLRDLVTVFRSDGESRARQRDAAVARERALRDAVEGLADRDKDGPLPRRRITTDDLRAALAEHPAPEPVEESAPGPLRWKFDGGRGAMLDEHDRIVGYWTPPEPARRDALTVTREWDERGGAMWFDREEWGVITDALIEHRASTEDRKKGRPDSTCSDRAQMCADLIRKMNDADGRRPALGLTVTAGGEA